MSRQLTVSEILRRVGMATTLADRQGLDAERAETITEASANWLGAIKYGEQSLKALVTEMVNEIIGEGEAHVSHVCPQDSIPCREFAARGQLRHEQRQRAKAEIERRFK